MAATLQAVVALNTSQFTSGMSSITQLTSNLTGAMSIAFGGVTSEILSMGRAFGPMGAAIQTFKEITATAMGFEDAMAEIASVTGRSMDSVDEFGQIVEEVTGNSKFQLGEVAASAGRLAAAGFESADAMRSGLKPALDLAAAGGIATGEAVDVMVAALRAFNLDASASTQVVDTFAAGAAIGLSTINSLSEAFKYAAPSAAAFDLQMDETVAVLALFEDRGSRGSLAGTAFAQAMRALTQAAADGQGAIGAALAEWNPATEGIAGAVRRLEEAGISASEAMIELGDRGGRSVATLLNAGSEAVVNYTDKMHGSSTAADMAAVKHSTLSASFTGVIAQFQLLANSIGKEILPQMKAFNETTAAVVGSITGWVNANQGLIAGIAVLLPKIIGNAGLAYAVGPALMAGFQQTTPGVEKFTARLLGLKTGFETTWQQAVYGNFAMLDYSQGEIEAMKAAGMLTKEMEKNIQAQGLMSGAVVNSTWNLSKAKDATHSWGESLNLTQKALLVFGAAAVGIQLGNLLMQIPAVREAMEGLATSLMKATGAYVEIDPTIDAYRQRMATARAEMLANIEAQKALQKQMADQAALDALNEKIKAAGLNYDIFSDNVERNQRKLELLKGVTAGLSTEKAGLALKVGDLIQRLDAQAQAMDLDADATERVKKATEAQRVAAQNLIEVLTNLTSTDKQIAEAQAKLEAATNSLNEEMGKSSSEMQMAAEIAVKYGYRIDEAKALVAEFGEEADYVAGRSRGLGISLQTAAEHFRWLKENGETAAAALRLLNVPLGEIPGLLDAYGARTVEVVQHSQQMGMSWADAANDLGLFKSEVKDTSKETKNAIDLIGEIKWELPFISEELAARWTKFFKDIDDLKLAPVKLDLAVPFISQDLADRWLTFLKAINAIASEISIHIVLPFLTEQQATRWSDFLKVISSANVSIAVSLPHISQELADRYIELFKALGGVGGVDLGKIGDVPDFHGTLQSIDGSLKSLVQMKGVIWA